MDGWYDKRTILLGFAAGISGVAASLAVGDGVAGVFGAGLALLMLSIAAVDAKIYLIPDQLNAAGVLLGLANALVLGHGDPTWPAEAALRALVVVGAFLGLRAVYLGLRRRHGIGLGDVKLAAVAGAWLDWSIVPIAIELAALGALAVFGFRRFVLGKPMSHNARLPFGLFFAPAIWGCWLLRTALANAG
ncbi:MULTISPECIES: A24 family peptidase [unclassified Bradyrhizobium]|uniref:prepilin peptidase n=1 Tax=unclassified Bradyrhizobium TaxID=2631580 RepID=UPI001E4D4CAA|nr:MULTISPECIES: A24 family peptidase [unclassified Bradyrhizobium]